MRKLSAVPLTKDNFEEEYKIATGLNFIDVKWIESHKPEDENEKYVYLAKLIRNIQLNLDRWVDGELDKGKSSSWSRFLSFQDAETRDKFYDNYSDMIDEVATYI